MMMTRAIATSEGGGGKSTERGGQRENRGTRLDISIQKPHWQPGRTECGPIISINQRSWEGEDQRKGDTRKEKWV